MQMAVLLKKHGGKRAAAGWDGDRYAIFEDSKNRLALVWLSTWDSEDDAREFAHAYVAYQSAKVGDLGKPPKPIPDSVWRNLDDRLFVVQRRGHNVAVVEGFSPELTPGLIEAAFQAKQTEVKPADLKPDASKTSSAKPLTLAK
jgi:hypothetical protein